MADAGAHLDGVGLDPHAAAAPVAELAARHVAVERLAVELAARPGMPSTIAVSPGPWDSPAVVKRKAVMSATGYRRAWADAI